MPHTRTWDAAYEATPPNTQNASQGAQRIRELKLDIRERLDLDHIMDDDDTNDGRHRHVALVEQSSDPGNLTDKGFLYTKEVDSLTELFYEDDAGTVFQVTSDGKLLLLGTNNSWTKGQAVAEVEITYGATITPDASLSNAFWCDLTGNVILAPPSAPKSGQVLTLLFKQDATGSRTLTFGTTIYGNVGNDWVLSTGANDIDLLTLYYDGDASRWRAMSLSKDIDNAL